MMHVRKHIQAHVGRYLFAPLRRYRQTLLGIQGVPERAYKNSLSPGLTGIAGISLSHDVTFLDTLHHFAPPIVNTFVAFFSLVLTIEKGESGG